ncbi:UNVERIFIED_CONTAM: Glycine-rich RNA-binding protein GRP1A [Sesamum radiatum]|uniref:Glycine-rich RNA-binding protein GRP1A n=1 Tax=Sesamum radiatum TaxID=300843 RepID=A0AAW2RX89_SESRA
MFRLFKPRREEIRTVRFHLICYSVTTTVTSVTVTSVTIINDRETGRSRGFGFVTFRDEQSMRDAIEAMNGQDLDGRSITVNEAQSRGGGGGGFRGPRREGGFGGGYGRREGGYGSGGAGSFGRREGATEVVRAGTEVGAAAEVMAVSVGTLGVVPMETGGTRVGFN